jgi:RNA-directed DNA polymerase
MGTVSAIVDATSHHPWRHINWRRAHKTVNRLQSRIVKTLREGNHRKVRALQNLLTQSLSAAAMAVKQVTENAGKRTPGIDRELWRTSRQKAAAMHAIRQRHYRAKPLRRIYIPKPGKAEKRPLSIPCMGDRAKQALHLLALDPVAEYYADHNSYGFRKKRSTADAIQACRQVLNRKHSAKWVLEGDIKACFDTISHDWLLKWIPMDKRVLAQWLKAGYMDKHLFHETHQGTPQGGIASPVLANLTLDGLEAQLNLQFKKRKVNFVRYADDFIITGESKELLENEIKPIVEKFLKIRGLTLSQEKTKITHIEEGFDFLGFNLRWINEKLIIKPAKAKVSSVLMKIKDALGKSLHQRPVNIIRTLNPIIRGWSNYYRHCCCTRTFTHLDHHVWQKLWQWANRRHPNKGKKWVKAKYFDVTQRSAWNFSGKLPSGKTIRLIKARHTRVKRHIKIRKEANPYDSNYAEYFEWRRKKTEKGITQLSG